MITIKAKLSIKHPSKSNTTRIPIRIIYGFKSRFPTYVVSMTGILLIAKNWPNKLAPIKIKKINAVNRTDSFSDPFKLSHVSFLEIKANKSAPNAPTPAASVGVKTPK